MDDRHHPLAAVSHFIHRYFLWLLIGSYLFAGFLPPAGLRIRNVTFGHVTLWGETTRVSLPMVMLAWLLLNAGLGVETGRVRTLLRRPGVLLGGLAANVLVPVAFIFAVSVVMRVWHNPDEVQVILVGLALVAAMPIAGSSTAWTQNARGDLALGLGLVLASTFLSPLTTPVTFGLVEQVATGRYAQALDDLEGNGTGALLLSCVLVPSILGMAARPVIGAGKLTSAQPILKVVNSVNLLLLNYSNASVSLPQVVAAPDWDFLAVTLAMVVGLCVIAFASGWYLARLLRADPAQRVALMFGLGMNNNGTGLVLASMALANQPRVLLPVIFYNLVQHLVAGAVDVLITRTPSPPPLPVSPESVTHDGSRAELAAAPRGSGAPTTGKAPKQMLHLTAPS
jgi:BASS family bile acid:Na+ symporter